MCTTMIEMLKNIILYRKNGRDLDIFFDISMVHNVILKKRFKKAGGILMRAQA